jgi:hypothetical protein
VSGDIMSKAAAVCALVTSLVAAAASPGSEDWDVAGKRWWAHVEYLADDQLEGRETGTPGFASAADYVEKQFREAGLQPAGTKGFRQMVAFQALQVDETQSHWEIEREHRYIPIELGTDAVVGAGPGAGEPINAQAVFVGYGFAAPERGFNEFAGLDLKGKLAVIVQGRPSSIPGPISTFYEAAEERWKALKQAGAVGYITVASPKLSLPWERIVAGRKKPKLFVDEPALDDENGLKFHAIINPEHAEKFFAGSGHTLGELQSLADAGQPLPKFPLAGTYHVQIAMQKLPELKAPNIIGVLHGSDPNLSREYVVVSAHLDHLGIGEPINGDKIYHGAMDNASGSASLIEIAKALGQSAPRPQRSVLFLSLTGEEEGMLGSRYFVAHPTVPLGEIVAAINMDMYLPLFPLRYLEVQGLGESTLGNDIRAVAQRNDVEVQFDKQPPENRFIRSDQASFVKRGIPGLAFKFGWLPGSAEEKSFNEWIHARYHAPSDDLAQPVDIAAAAKFTYIIGQLVSRVADAKARPSWYEESFYAHLDKRLRQ